MPVKLKSSAEPSNKKTNTARKNLIFSSEIVRFIRAINKRVTVAQLVRAQDS